MFFLKMFIATGARGSLSSSAAQVILQYTSTNMNIFEPENLANLNLTDNKKIGTRRVHVSAKKLDSHFVFS
jgi:hypothetical protein